MFSKEDYARRDEELKAGFESLNLSKWDLVTSFPSFFRRRDLARLLAHYELFKLVADLPGVIVDLGVFRGASLFTWAKLLETFCPGDRARKVFGFDWFRGLQDFRPQDGVLDDKVGKREGGYGSDAAILARLVELNNQDGLLPGIDRVEVVVGDVRETLPRFLASHPGLRVSLLHFDLDLYEPTLAALRCLYPVVAQGGVVVFDEYGVVPWEGETRAVEDYFREIGKPLPRLAKFPFSQQPHGYFVKRD